MMHKLAMTTAVAPVYSRDVGKQKQNGGNARKVKQDKKGQEEIKCTANRPE
jgi:hypothetical protein